MISERLTLNTPQLAYTLFWIAAVSLCFCLSFWQWQRHLEKLQLNKAPELITITGHWQSTLQLLLDNRVRQGILGYEVLSIFQTLDGQELLINRGWLPAHTERQSLPQLPKLTTTQVSLDIYHAALSSRLPEPNVETFNTSNTHTKLLRIQAVHPSLAQMSDLTFIANTSSLSLTDETNASTSANYLKLHQGEGKLITDHWQPNWLTPERHKGYALQWFVLAIVLLILGSAPFRNTLKSRSSSSANEQEIRPL